MHINHNLPPLKTPIKRISDGKTIIINSMVHYPGTEQYAVEVIEGFGAFAKTERFTISEHALDDFNSQFNINVKKQQIIMETNNTEVLEQNKDNFNEVRSILFDTMRGLKDGSVKPDVAKQISETAQTIINTVKVELDFVKMSGGRDKPRMLS